MVNNLKMKKIKTAIMALCFISTVSIFAQEKSNSTSADDLAKQLQNPIANLISLPIQGNFDFGVGPADGSKMTLNIQPVIPVSISENLNLVTRTILPVISQSDVPFSGQNKFGLGDVVATAFFSPKAPTKSGIIWGVGPVLLLPTSTDRLLGAGEFGAGPSAVALTQKGSITIGALINHIWADNISNTFLNPFVAKNFTGGYALTLNTELTQSWEQEAFTGVVMLQGSKVFKVGNQAINGAIAPRMHFGGNKAADWGFRAMLIFLFPK